MMKRKTRLRGIASTAALCVVMMSVLQTGRVFAQSPEESQRTYRHLGVGEVSFLNTWDPAIHAGYLFQVSLKKSQVVETEFGTKIVPPRWVAHGQISAGWALDSNGRDDSGFSGLGQLGVMHSFEGPMTINRIGVVGLGSWGPEGAGVAVRTELFHGNAAVSVGWMSFDGPRSDGAVVTIDLMRCIFQDLGLVKKCRFP